MQRLSTPTRSSEANSAGSAAGLNWFERMVYRIWPLDAVNADAILSACLCLRH